MHTDVDNDDVRINLRHSLTMGAHKSGNIILKFTLKVYLKICRKIECYQIEGRTLTYLHIKIVFIQSHDGCLKALSQNITLYIYMAKLLLCHAGDVNQLRMQISCVYLCVNICKP